MAKIIKRRIYNYEFIVRIAEREDGSATVESMEGKRSLKGIHAAKASVQFTGRIIMPGTLTLDAFTANFKPEEKCNA